MADRPWYEDAPVPQLMREARDVYRHAVVVALAGVRCDDVPRNGAFVLADLDLGGSTNISSAATIPWTGDGWRSG